MGPSKILGNGLLRMRFQPYRLVMFLVLLAVAGSGSASAEEVYLANPQPPTDGKVGANYTPAYAVNQVQFWHDFRPEVVEKELAAAQEHFGISTLRVFLHNINFDQEREVFLANLETFLTICERNGIRPGFVFFDDCHREDGIFLDQPTAPVKGFHNGRWAWCPQKRERDPEDLEKFKSYVQEVVRAHRADQRVLFWEIFNEPAPGAEYSRRLSQAGYRWAKEVEPIQPVINCCKGPAGWGDTDVSDIVDSHLYQVDRPAWDRMADANSDKGTVFTEAGARWYAPRRNFGEPCGVLHWLEDRRGCREIHARRLPLLGTDGRQFELPVALGRQTRHSRSRPSPGAACCGRTPRPSRWPRRRRFAAT